MPRLVTATALLVEAHQGRHPVRVSPDEGPADPRESYAVQAQVWHALAGSARPTAWKVGAPRIDAEPLAAPVLPERLCPGCGRLPREMFTSVTVEAEIAVRFGRALPARQTPYSRQEILDAIESLHVAMELVDARLADPEAAGPNWRLADNLLNGALVIGDALPGWREIDWSSREVTLEADGRVLDRRTCGAPLNDLFHCLSWWLSHAGGARPGDIVTTGAWSGAHPAGSAARLSATFSGLGMALVEIVT